MLIGDKHVMAFLSMMDDSDLNVKKQAFSTLNALIHSIPTGSRSVTSAPIEELVVKHVLRRQPDGSINPNLLKVYKATVVDESLIRVVDLGHTKARFDDGLPTRKCAY